MEDKEERDFKRRKISATRDFPPRCKNANSKVKMDSKSDDAEESNARNRVEEILKLFRATCWKLIQDEKYIKRIDMEAYNILKKNINFVNLSCQQFGNIPGVNVGDRFKYRIELKLVGLHRPPRNGIDYMKVNEQSLATSIVDSGGYENQVGSKHIYGSRRRCGLQEEAIGRSKAYTRKYCIEEQYLGQEPCSSNSHI